MYGVKSCANERIIKIYYDSLIVWKGRMAVGWLIECLLVNVLEIDLLGDQRKVGLSDRMECQFV